MQNLTPIAPQFATTGPTTIESKGSNMFYDADGNVMFTIEKKGVTVSGRIVIRDAESSHVGHIRKKKTSMIGRQLTYYLGTNRYDKIGAIKAKE